MTNAAAAETRLPVATRRLATTITNSLKEKGYMAAWSAGLLTSDMMQAFTRSIAFTLAMNLDEESDARRYLDKLEVAVDDVIATWFTSK